jgi:hypothetical protein
LAQAEPYGLTQEFAKGIRGNPASSSGIHFQDAFRFADRRAIQINVSLADLPQRPVYCFTNEIAVVPSFTADDGKQLQISAVVGLFVMYGQISHQGKSSALLELGRPCAPLQGLLPRQRSMCEEMTAGPITHIPIIEVANPPLHLRRSDEPCFVHQSRKNARVVDTGVPEPQSQPVIFPDMPGQRVHLRLGHSVHVLRVNGEPRHALDILAGSQAAKVSETTAARPEIAVLSL